MALFRKKNKEEKKDVAKETTPVASKQETEKPSLSVYNVKVPTPAAAQNTTASKESAAISAKEVKPAVKTVPAKAPAKTAAKAPAKASAKAAATKTATKPATTAKPVAKAAKAPAKAPAVTAVPTVARPFFVKTEEDVRIAFDQAIAEADAEILRNEAKAVGKYEFELEVDGFHFYLLANNGQVLFDSPSFTTLLGALKGIETFKKTVAEEPFDVRKDKYDRYRFILARKYYGENYTTKEQCQKCVDSVKNFANNSKIIRYTPTKENIAVYEAAKNCKRVPEDVNWTAIEQAELQSPKMGKFEICKEDDQYTFYLLANNGQILYSSRYYANENACRRGIDSFKRAAYVGNFFVDRDKFGNFRYVLKNIGSAPAFIGESYDNKPQCEKIIDSVKKFIVSATIELEA